MTISATSSTNSNRSNRPVQASDLLKHPKQGNTTLYLVRHGQTAANLGQQLVGSTDVPLDPLGERQARRIAERFTGLSIDALLSSPLQRARFTAERIGEITGHEPELVPGLTEVNFGDLEGLTIEQVVAQFPELRPKLDDIHDLELQWPGGETRRAFHERVLATFIGILERYESQTVAVVCHGGVIGSFIAQIEGGPPSDYVRYAVANCSLTQLAVTADQTLIHLWNDITHLDEVDSQPLRMRPDGATDA